MGLKVMLKVILGRGASGKFAVCLAIYFAIYFSGTRKTVAVIWWELWRVNLSG